MKKNEVSPNWAQVVENFMKKVTDEHYELAKTWLFPGPEPGDIPMPNPSLAYKSHETPDEQETFSHSNVSTNTLPTGTQPQLHVSRSSSTAIRISNNFQDPLLHSVSPSQEKASQNDHLLLVPPLINLETSRLRRSPRITALNDQTQDGPVIVAYTSSTTQPHSQRISRPKPKLSFSLSLLWLGFDGTLQLQSLFQIMSIFPLLPKLQMTLNKSMASLMTRLMRYIIMFRHVRLQTNSSLILKCCVKMIK